MFRIASLTLLLLSASAALAAEVPRLDIEATCRAAPILETGDRSPYLACMGDEMDARTQLERQWASFNPRQREMCFQETHIGGSQSYVDVLTCIQLASGNPTPNAPAE
jgi:hypothetical protein